jgi:hypothetical protein
MSVVSLSVLDPRVTNVSLCPRNDLVPPCVALYFIKTNSVNGASQVVQEKDIWPVGANPKQRRALVGIVNLAGSKANIAEQPVQTIPIPTGNSGTSYGDALMQWCTRNNADLQLFTVGNMKVVPGTLYTLLVPSQKDGNGNALTGFSIDGSDFPRQLITGSIPPWLVAPANVGTTTKNDGYVHAAKVTFSFQVQYLENSPANDKERAAFYRIFGGVAQWFTFTIMATDALTQTYSRLVSYDGGEETPTGLAKYLYESLTLHQDGSFTLTEQECEELLNIGDSVNLTEGRPEWAAMNALVQSLDYDLQPGKTQVRVGPPKVFSAATLLSMLRAWRSLVPMGSLSSSSSSEGRQTGAVSSTQQTSPGTGQTPESSSGGSSAAPKNDFSLYDAGKSGDSAQLGVTNGTLKPGSYMGGGLGVMPDGMDGTTPFKIAVGGSNKYAWIKVTIDNSDPKKRPITDRQIQVGDTLPIVTAGDDSVYYIQLGVYQVNSDKSIAIESGAQGIGSQVINAEYDNYSHDPVVYQYAEGAA